MIQKKHDDGSISEFYQNGDLVRLTKKRGYNQVGEWGEVHLDLDDRRRGSAKLTSFVCVITAGVSTHKDSFQRCISSVPVWCLESVPQEMAEAYAQAKKQSDVGGMTPSVFRYFEGDIERFGYNFQPQDSEIGQKFHLDHGAGINKNEDGEIIWLKNRIISR